MGLQERRRAASLIQAEFSARFNALVNPLTDEDVERKAASIAKAMKLTPIISKLERLRCQVAEIEKQLAEAVSKIRGSKAQKKYRNECECHGDFEEMLANAARAALEEEASKDDSLAKLRSEERRLLAQIESSNTTDEIKAVLKKAWLVS